MNLIRTVRFRGLLALAGLVLVVASAAVAAGRPHHAPCAAVVEAGVCGQHAGDGGTGNGGWDQPSASPDPSG